MNRAFRTYQIGRRGEGRKGVPSPEVKQSVSKTDRRTSRKIRIRATVPESVIGIRSKPKRVGCRMGYHSDTIQIQAGNIIADDPKLLFFHCFYLLSFISWNIYVPSRHIMEQICSKVKRTKMFRDIFVQIKQIGRNKTYVYLPKN